MDHAVQEAGGRVSRVLTLCAAWSLGVAAPRAALAAPTELVVRAGLEIDATAAGAASPIIHARLDELGNRQLRRAEVLPGRDGRDPAIRITVREVVGEEPGYVIASALVVDGAVVPTSLHETDCRLCTEGEAVERATAEVERLVPFVRDHARAREEAAAPPPSSPPPVEAPPPPQGLGARGKAGIALVALGGVSLGAGVGLALRQPTPDPDLPRNVITTRPAGFALIGVGAAAVVVAAVLIALDRRQAPRRGAVAPAFGSGSAGLTITGSF